MTITVAHYARTARRALTFTSAQDRAEFFALPPAAQERVRDLHHAFVFVASCENTEAGIYGVCYGRRNWSLKTIYRLFRKWTAANENWRSLIDPRSLPK